MLFIGITGEAGAGKSRVLEYLSKKDRVFVLIADELARKLSLPGGDCYQAIKNAFPDEGLYLEDKSMDRAAFAKLVFSDKEKLQKLNDCIHPVVKKHILSDVSKKRSEDKYDFYFLEAALLLEEGYDRLCDEIWYVSAEKKVREERLFERGYSREKIKSVMDLQLKKEEFLCRTNEIIENSGIFPLTEKRIEELLKERRPQ